jgi:glycosyltransferase involved in cell wall biosynthesis
MKLGLFMMVKNEANRIGHYLAKVLDLFEQVMVVDTGSTDGTPDLLRDLGVDPAFDRLDPCRCYSHADVRNRGISKLDTPWILTLDADECIQREALEALVRKKPLESAGVLSPWINWRSDGSSFEDYKCSVFRNGIAKRGLIHDNVQIDLRHKGLVATWNEQLVIDHFPEEEKMSDKRKSYIRRLACATRREPEWYRYHWFAGYTLFRHHNTDSARDLLSIAAKSHSTLFPVECLNAKMVLADLQSRHGDLDLVREILDSAIGFYRQVERDFEVQVNFRLAPWLDLALEASKSGHLEKIQAYEFAY